MGAKLPWRHNIPFFNTFTVCFSDTKCAQFQEKKTLNSTYICSNTSIWYWWIFCAGKCKHWRLIGSRPDLSRVLVGPTLMILVLCWLHCTSPQYANAIPYYVTSITFPPMLVPLYHSLPHHTLPYHTLMTCPPVLPKLLENAKGAAAHQATFLHLWWMQQTDKSNK